MKFQAHHNIVHGHHIQSNMARGAQELIPANDSPPLGKAGIKLIQQVVGSFLYYCRATDTTIPTALSELSQLQTKATENTMQ